MLLSIIDADDTVTIQFKSGYPPTPPLYGPRHPSSRPTVLGSIRVNLDRYPTLPAKRTMPCGVEGSCILVVHADKDRAGPCLRSGNTNPNPNSRNVHPPAHNTLHCLLLSLSPCSKIDVLTAASGQVRYPTP